MARQDLTPDLHPHNTLHATTLHSHLLPAHTPAPRSHLYFGYKQPVPGAHLGLSQSSLRTARPSTSPTRLGKVYKRALVVPPSSPHQRAFVCGAWIGTAQVGVSLVSLFDPLFKRRGARQAEGRQPRSRRAPTGADQSKGGCQEGSVMVPKSDPPKGGECHEYDTPLPSR